MKNKNILIFYLFAILTYASQGITGLFGQLQYYFLHEHLGMSLTKMGVIGFIIGIPWVVKMFIAILIDYFPIGKLYFKKHKNVLSCGFSKTEKYRVKYYLWFDNIGLILCYLGMMYFGLHVWTYLLFGFLINCFISLNDISCDSTMIVYEKRYNLQGKGVSIQWIALGVVGLFTSLIGAKLSETMNYQMAYGIALLFPIAYLLYLRFIHVEEPVKKKKVFNFKSILHHFKNKEFLWGLVFIACLQLTPSFGTGLMAQMREVIGVSKMFVGVLGSVGTVFGLFGYILYFKWGNKFKLKQLLIFSIIFSAITNMFYLYIPTQWHIMVYSVLFGAFSGVSFMAIMKFMTSIIPEGNEGMIYACVASLSNLCGNGSGILSGIIYDKFGYFMAVWISTIFTVLCLFIIPKLKILDKQ